MVEIHGTEEERTAACAYLPYFILYEPPLSDYLRLLQGISLELLGFLLLVARSAYLKPEGAHISAATDKKRFPTAGIMLTLGLSFVVFIGIALAPQSGCSMQLNTLPAPGCAYVPYSILFVWGGWYIMVAGIAIQFAGLLIFLLRSECGHPPAEQTSRMHSESEVRVSGNAFAKSADIDLYLLS